MRREPTSWLRVRSSQLRIGEHRCYSRLRDGEGILRHGQPNASLGAQLSPGGLVGPGAILAVAPGIYDQSLRLPTGNHWPVEALFLAAIAAFITLLGIRGSSASAERSGCSWWPSWLACPLPLLAASAAYQLALSYPHRSRRARPRRGSCSSPRSQSTRSMRTAIATSRKRITIERDRSTAVAPGGVS